MATNTLTFGSAVPSTIATTILARALTNLDGYLTETRHAADHPWRIEIRQALTDARNAQTSTIFDAPYSKVVLEPIEILDQTLMRSAQLRGILYGMMSAPDGDEMYALAYELAADLAEDIRIDNFNSARTTQLSRLLFLIQDGDGPDDLLWLCQQFADEINVLVGVLAGKTTEVTK